MATFDPKYASVPNAAPAPNPGQWDPKYASIAPSARTKAPMSPAMPKLGFGGVSTFQTYQPDTMSTVSRQVLDAAKKIKASPYEPSDQEIAEAKKKGVLTREQAQYVIRLNGDKEPKEVLRDLVENQGYRIEGLDVEPAKRYEQPETFGGYLKKSAKQTIAAPLGVVAGSGIKLAGWVVDIGEELLGGGDGAGEAIKRAGESLQESSMDFGQVEGEGTREAAKFVSDVAFPVWGIGSAAAKYASKAPGVAKAAEILSKSPALAKAATALGPDKIAGVAARGAGYGALGTAMTADTDLGDIAQGWMLGAGLGWALAAATKVPAIVGKLPASANQAAERLSSSFNKVNKADAAKFEKMTGENVGQFLVRRGITTAGEDTMGQVANLFTKSLENADEGIGAIEGNFRFTGKKTDYLATAMDDLAKKFSETLDENGLSRVESLAGKYKADGLTMSEINEVKRLYQNSQKFGYMAEAVSPEKVQRATNVLDNIRSWQFKVAEKEGLTNLPEINKNTQAYRSLLKMMEKKELGSEVNNSVGLTDWIVLTQDPAMFLGKQVGKTDWFKGKAIGAFAGDASKPQLANPDIAGIIGRNVEKQYASPSVLSRGNPSLVVRDQVALPAPSGKPTLTSPVTNVKPILGMAPGKTEEITARSKIINPQKASSEFKNIIGWSIGQEEDLVALHNLSKDKLRKVVELGWAPGPSIAITRKGIPFDQFGDVTLVGNKDLIDPLKNPKNRIFSADVYSPRVPQESEMAFKLPASKLPEEYSGIKNYPAFKEAFKESETVDDLVMWLENDQQLMRHVEKLAEREGKDAYDYVNEFARKAFQIKKPTVESIVEKMFEKGNVAEETWFSSTHTLMGLMADEFKNIGEINRSWLSEKTPELQKAYDQASDAIHDIVLSVGQKKDGWIWYNVWRALDGMIDYYKSNTKRTAEGLKRFLKDEYSIQATSDDAKNLIKAAENMSKLPKDYFEAKLERGVKMNEFTAVLVPEEQISEIKSILKWTGLEDKVVGYAKNESRSSKLDEVNRKYGKIFFSVGWVMIPAASMLNQGKSQDKSSIIKS